MKRAWLFSSKGNVYRFASSMSGYLDCKELCYLVLKIYSNLIVKYANEKK